MTFDCFRFSAEGEVVEVARRTDLPLYWRSRRSILEVHLGAPRVGRRIERPSYVHYPWCIILAWVAIFCIGHNLPLYRQWERCSIFHYYCIWLEICVYEYIIFHFFILIFVWLHICIHYVECSSRLQLMRLQYLLLRKQ